VANTLSCLNGAVGFIDWLGCVTVISL
jgi:hypothetical protein